MAVGVVIMDYKTIVKQIGVTYIIKSLSMITNFLFFALVTSCLTSSEYGILSLLLTTMTLVNQLFGFNLTPFFIRDLVGLSVKEKLNRLKSVMPLYLLCSLFGIFMLILFRKKLLSILNFQISDSLFILSMITVAMIISADSIRHFLKPQKELILQAIHGFSKTKLWMLFVVLWIILFNDITVSEIIYIYSGTIFFVVFITYMLFYKRYHTIPIFSKSIDLNYFKKAFFYSFPLVPLIISEKILTASDRYFLQIYYNSSVVGDYSYIYTLVGFTLNISVIIVGVLYPYIAEQFKKDKKQYMFLFNLCIKYSLIILLPMLFGIYALGRDIILTISNTSYLSALSIMPILILFPIFQFGVDILSKPLLLMGKTKLITYIFLCGMIFNLILNYILIPTYGGEGAAVATVLSYSMMLVLMYMFVKNEVSIKLNYINIPKILLSCIILYLVLNIPSNSNIIKILIVPLGVLCYCISLIIFGTLTNKELSSIMRVLNINNKR
jgi:O-antigen/teichoic acid export membrane protein